jgi:peroxiredoxin
MAVDGGSGWLRKLGLPAAVGLVALLALTVPGRFAPLDVGSRAPRYAAATLAGDTVRLEDLREEVVLVNVWATWCRPCVREMPALQRLHEAMASEGLRVVAVNVDNADFGADPPAMVRSFVSEHGLTFDILLDPANRIESVFQVAGLPMTFVIDRKGRIRQRVMGAREWDAPAMQAELRSLLEE